MTEPATTHPDEISLSELVRPIWERRWAVLAVTLLAGLTAFAISSLLPPTFTASATVLVGGSRASTGNPLQDLQLGERLVQSYAEIARSRSVAERALAEVGADLAVRDFQSATSVRVVPGTLLLRISHDAVTPLDAAAGANAIARALIAQLEATSTEDLPLVNATIQEAAFPPEERSAPRRSLNTLIGLFLGLFLGIGGAAVHNALDRTVKGPQDLEALGLLSLAEIPFLPGHEKGLVTKSAQVSAAGEAYRALRTNLRFFELKHQTKTLVLTSTDEAAGKSTVAANLGVTVAQNDQNVVLVDCDLRRPGVSSIFDLNGRPGVTDILLGQATVDSAGKKEEGGKLTVIGRGASPPNPAEVLGSPQMASLIQEVSGKAEMVILDTPPALPVTDAFVVAGLADAVLLVARRGKTNRDELAELKKRFETLGIRVLGAVLTDAELRRKSRYSYYTAGLPPRS